MSSVNPSNHRLLPYFFEECARRQPAKILALLPKDSSSIDAGFTKIDYAAFKHASDQVAWWLDRALPVNVSMFSYCGARDMFFPCLTNPLKALDDAFTTVECSAIIFGDQLPEPQSSFGKLCELRPNLFTCVLPAVDFFFQRDLNARQIEYPITLSWDKNLDDVAGVFQSTGTTGDPKCVNWTHRRVVLWLEHFELVKKDPSIVHLAFAKQTVITSLNLFWHVGTQVLHLVAPIYQGGVVVYLPSKVTTSMASLLKAAKLTGSKTMIVTPIYMQEVAANAELLSVAREMDHIISHGAPLDIECTNKITTSSRCRISNVFNSLENAPHIHRQLDSDLRYLRFDDRNGISFVQKTENTYELVINNSDESGMFQPVFCTWPNLQKLETGDLFQPHPEHHGYWRFVGRSDDTVVLANCYGIGVFEMQRRVEAHCWIRAALIGGQAQPRTCLIIEPEQAGIEGRSKEEFIDAIWPAVMQANAISTEIGQIRKEMIIVSEKPFQRSLKGAVQRNLTLAQLQSEMDELYASLNQANLLKHYEDTVVSAMSK